MTLSSITPAIPSIAALSSTINVGKDTEATIPCFDLRYINLMEPAKRAELIRQFGDGLRDIGFVALYAPEVTPKVEAAIKVMKNYYAQPRRTKMFDWHDNNGQTGYSYQGLETPAGAKAADLKETFFITPDMLQWPLSIPEFQPVMADYLETLSDYAANVIGFLLEYLGEGDEVNRGVANEGDRRIRLAYYPQRQPTDDPVAVWAGAHQDLNGVTLLPRPSRSGLELKTKEGQWLPVECPPDHIIVNCGDEITKKTAGYITGTEHRVVNNDSDNLDPRYSTILFSSLPDGYSVRPFESCAAKAAAGMSPSEAGAYLSRFPDVTVAENRFARLIEMGAVKNVTAEQIIELRNKGLIQQPCESLRSRFPTLFN